MHIVICDDASDERKRMHKYLTSYFKEKDIHAKIVIYSSGEQLLKEADRLVDIYFLDVEMPGMNGIETSRKIRERDERAILIFTTAHLEYATEGYSVKAYRYLLKPIAPERLIQELEGALKEIRLMRTKIILPTLDGEHQMVEVNDICFISVYGHETQCHLCNGEIISTKLTLKQYCGMPELYQFFQVHKSYLINLEKIQKVLPDTVFMESEEYVAVSRHRMKEFKQALLRKWEGRLN